eukprot:CAMPEP_0173454928 /NCGR_PEP_ID=MMETSP1357-20121228/53333_1 /TAXON_ID=77926 /ORGANISM="Hemiselmis rufescens, Strain PCC563" /LENGTH=33 /DNA_ID= /DNA_START= /DNA_END= /DNA_ORIENTATION=
MPIARTSATTSLRSKASSFCTILMATSLARALR